jgi:hypothetical protein
VGGEAVVNRWAVSRWTVVDEKQNGDHWLPATDHRSPITDQPRSWAYSLRGFGVGWCEKRPGGGEGCRERRGRFVFVPKPGWTLSAGLRCVLGVLVWIGGHLVGGRWSVVNRWSVRRW